MNKLLFTIDPSEKRRILEMHQSATKKHYLSEQTEPATATPTSATTQIKSSVIGGVTIPGFLFAEDDTEWFNLKNKETGGKVSQEMYSIENGNRVYAYYGAETTGADPNNIYNKYMIAFNSTTANSNIYPTSKENVYQKTFLIGKVYSIPKKFTIIAPSEGSSGFHVRVPPKGGTTRGKGWFLLNSGDLTYAYGFNNVFNRVADNLDSVPYEQLDPKFKFSK